MKILITGANGFLGSHFCLLAAGGSDLVLAGVREGSDISSIEKIQGLKIYLLDYSSVAALTNTFNLIRAEHGDLDVIVHNAGLTKSTDVEKFYQINLGLTCTVIEAIKNSGILGDQGKFAYVSSMAAVGPRPFTGPVSSYGLSKQQAEKAVVDSGLNYLIFRPTGLYGPYDQEFLPLFKVVKYGIFPILSRKDQKMTLVHGADAALNLINCLKLYENRVIHLVSTDVYTHRDLKNALCSALGRKALPVIVPTFIIRSLLSVIEQIAKLVNKRPQLPLEKYNEISGDWDPDLTEERKEVPLEFNFSLNRGFSDTLAFYKSKNLI